MRHYKSPYHSPFQPRNDRYCSRSHSNSKPYSNYQYKPTGNFTQQLSSPIHHPLSMEPKFEINICHPNTSSCSQSSTLSNNHANAITPSIWFVSLYLFKSPEDTHLLSKLETLFLLDNGASVCALNLPTFTILADYFLKCSKCTPTNNDFNSLTVANKAEVFKFNVILTLHTSIHGSAHTLLVPFAVANIK